MHDLKVPEGLWATSIMPEGVLERWIVADGALVKAGEPVAALRIEGALHEILATLGGRITFVVAANGVVEPGMVVAQIGDSAAAGQAPGSQAPESSDSASRSFIAEEAHAAATEGHVTLSFRVGRAGSTSEDLTVQVPTSVADRLVISLGSALAVNHATDAAEMVKRFTAGLTARR